MLSAAYDKALEDAIAVLDKIAMPVDANDRKFCCYFSFSFYSSHLLGVEEGNILFLFLMICRNLQ